MKRVLALVLIFGLSLSSFPVLAQGPAWSVYFSPKGGCTAAIIQQLDQAKTEVLVQAYSFTSARIAKALLEAHKRGVRVEVILDKSQKREKYSSADFVAHAGIRTLIDDKHAIAHNKIISLPSCLRCGPSKKIQYIGFIEAPSL
jgi:phosphatidylserine/phosphatidylglycerophosphate/cardiolipin synthase-like enzyme